MARNPCIEKKNLHGTKDSSKPCCSTVVGNCGFGWINEAFLFMAVFKISLIIYGKILKGMTFESKEHTGNK